MIFWGEETKKNFTTPIFCACLEIGVKSIQTHKVNAFTFHSVTQKLTINFELIETRNLHPKVRCKNFTLENAIYFTFFASIKVYSVFKTLEIQKKIILEHELFD